MRLHLRYVLFIVLGTAVLLSGYLLSSYVSAGIFGIRTLSLVLSGVIMFSILTVFSLQRVESWFNNRIGLKHKTYLLLIVIGLILALILIYLGIGSGGVDYTNYMAQQS